MKFTITITQTDLGQPSVEFSGGNIKEIAAKVRAGAASPTEQYALVAMAAVIKMSNSAEKAEDALRGIILP